MRYVIRLMIALLLSSLLAIPHGAMAEDDSNNYQIGNFQNDPLMPYTGDANKFIEILNEAVNMQKDINNFSLTGGDISYVSYNQNGNIDCVIYTNGTRVDYHYTYSADGKLLSCTMSFSTGTERFVLHVEEQDDNFVVKIYRLSMGNNGNKGGKDDDNKETDPEKTDKDPYPPVTPDSEEDPDIVIVYPKGAFDLDDIATTPMKFDIDQIGAGFDSLGE